MSDLSTTYLGLTLKNPLVASASPISKDIGVKGDDGCARIAPQPGHDRTAEGSRCGSGQGAGAVGRTVWFLVAKGTMPRPGNSGAWRSVQRFVASR